MNSNRYWLYAPGEKAKHWDEFYNKGIIGLGWDSLGDLNQYDSKDEINEKVTQLFGEGKMNTTFANYQFKYEMNIGDVIIVKNGRSELLGSGIVTSGYYYDKEASIYQKRRKVDWQQKGSWETNFSLALKTLTDITPYKTEDSRYNTYYDRLLGIMNGDSLFSELNLDQQPMKHALNTILYGPPGTGKTYNTAKYCAEILTGEDFTDRDNEARAIFNHKLGNQIEFITFHQNYSYEDFIQGLRPDIKSDNLSFEREDGIFKVISDRASRNLLESKDWTQAKLDFDIVFQNFISPMLNEESDEIEVKMKKSSYFINEVTEKTIFFRKTTGDSKHSLSINSLKRMYENGTNNIIKGGLQPYYDPLLTTLLTQGKSSKPIVTRQNYIIVIDEINRANISRVFGELITLIEEDKRSEGATPLKCKLPSGDEFQIPSNLFILGTMNTADKSIALLDIALRRRFEFVPLYPNPDLAETEEKKNVLEKINQRIFKDKGPDFQIGHAYFMKDDKLEDCMNKKVVPLLTEYYMNATDEVIGVLKEAGFETTNKNQFPIKVTDYNG